MGAAGRPAEKGFSRMHAGSLGGAVAADASQTAIEGCLFTLNKAQNQGGALYQSNTTGDVTTCTFSNNTSANGGAVYQNLAQGESSPRCCSPYHQT